MPVLVVTPGPGPLVEGPPPAPVVLAWVAVFDEDDAGLDAPPLPPVPSERVAPVAHAPRAAATVARTGTTPIGRRARTELRM